MDMRARLKQAGGDWVEGMPHQLSQRSYLSSALAGAMSTASTSADGYCGHPRPPPALQVLSRLTEDHQSAQPGHGMSTRARKTGHGAPERVLSQEQKRLGGLEKEGQKKRKPDTRVRALSSATGLKIIVPMTQGYRRSSMLQTLDGRARATEKWRTDSTGRPLHSGRHVHYILSFSHHWLAHVIRDIRVHEKSIESNGHLWAGSSARLEFGIR
ncbi:hypothetical protein B0T24DRAFT_593799 [Lasiosphaeria ovina]|uniref:Uncharacterized protein n=1 Tax=Lasiosphaeria ovina TaxID=92902 RepID=A0AAE0KCH6_9PEZI|nr:hypothetical protein B0T24DRAFT_593799 [Lasiosphaeria ovina]